MLISNQGSLVITNIYNDSCTTRTRRNNFERAIQNVWRHTNILRSAGFEKNMFLRMVPPEPVVYQFLIFRDLGNVLKRLWQLRAIRN